MTHPPFPRQFEHVHMAGKVGADIGMGVDQRIAHAGLGAEMDDRLDRMIGEQRLKCRHVGKVQFGEGEQLAMALFERRDPIALERDLIIVVEIVDADHGAPVGQQPVGHRHADEAGRAGYQDRQSVILLDRADRRVAARAMAVHRQSDARCKALSLISRSIQASMRRNT